MALPPFLEVRVNDATTAPALLAVCAGYEAGKWRAVQLAQHLLLDCLLDFVLSSQAAKTISSVTAGRQLYEAAKVVYETDKYRKRGEFGELLLHVIVRQFYGTLPAISKLWVKTGVNDTVKGFDAVHVTADGGQLQLWLGESKFYVDVDRAIYDVVPEIIAHLESEYLRREFILIANKLDPDSPHFDELSRLIAPQTSLDQIFSQLHVPVLITYDSNALAAHTAVDTPMLTALEAEVRSHWGTFASKNLPSNVMIHFILLPLCKKKDLLEELHTRLLQLQAL